jgi:hypothetical protein
MLLNNLSFGHITFNEYGGEDSGDDIYKDFVFLSACA